MKLSLPDTITSKQDLLDLVQELHDYSKWLSHANILKRTKTKAQNQEDYELSHDAKSIIKNSDISAISDTTALSNLIEEITKYSKSAPKITITLAAPATNDIKKILTGWCRNNLSNKMLIDFEFNRVILGGMVIRFGSHIYDWSFRRQILENRDKFPEVLRNV